MHHRNNGTVDVRDPHLLQIYTLDADDYGVAQHFDGSPAAELALKLEAKAQKKRAKSAKAGANGKANGHAPITAKRLEEVAKEFDELRLLDRPEVYEEEPNVDNVAPFSQIDTKRGLRVLPEANPGAKWTCHGCGVCCHGLAVEISKAEEARIDARLYQDLLKGESFAEDSFLNPDEGKKRTLRQINERNLACIFLSPEGLCYVHARQGMEAKPDACQMFPAMVMVVPEGPPRLGLRTNCASMYKSYEDGPEVSALVPHVARIVAKGEVHKAPEKIKWFGRKVAWKRLDAASKGILAAFDADGLSAETILAVDKQYLDGRVKKGMRRYATHVLKYLDREAAGPAPVEEGSYRIMVKRLTRGREAFEALKAGQLPGPVPKKVEQFLRSQIGHALYIGGPLNLPDAGYGLVGLMLALLGALHAIGPRGTLKIGNTAFEVFMMPLLETMEHSWPILDALDRELADELREELHP